jgi:SAM-dependent methyltransferase
VKPYMRAWLKLSWRSRRLHDRDLWELRTEVIRSLAPGKSVLDVGGMWSVHGRASFLAEEAGASRVLLMDAMPATEEFEAERRRRDSAVEYVTGDLNDAEGMQALGRFDVVLCTGVLYHAPHPLLQLENLRRVADGRLMLGTRVIPEVPGLEQACIFHPLQSEDARKEMARAYGDDAPRIGLTTPFEPEGGYANWWWGMSPSAVRAMMEVAGFEVLEEHALTPFLSEFLGSVR